jgi:hypothetical protein
MMSGVTPNARGQTSARAAHARLDFIQNHQYAAICRKAAHLCRKSGSGQRMPPSPWIGSSITAQVLSSMAVQGVDVVERHKRKPSQHRIETFFDLVLTCRGQGGHGASVKGLFHGNNAKPFRLARSLKIFSGQFNGRFVGFGAGVAEKDTVGKAVSTSIFASSVWGMV